MLLRWDSTRNHTHWARFDQGYAKILTLGRFNKFWFEQGQQNTCPQPSCWSSWNTLSRGVRGEREIKGIIEWEAVETVTDGFGFGCCGGGGGYRGWFWL